LPVIQAQSREALIGCEGRHFEGQLTTRPE